MVSVDETSASIRGRYAWSYRSPERSDSGAEDRTVAFSLSDRRYLEQRTDVSDYDEDDGRTLATWIWIPPHVQPGDAIPILEHTFLVTAVDASVEAAGAPRRAIELLAEPDGRRDDAYGSFTTSIIDRYWYDADTGMFLREVHEERCTGSLEGEPAAFTLRTTIKLVDSSYAQSSSPPPEEEYGQPPPPFVPTPVDPYDHDPVPSRAPGLVYLPCCVMAFVVLALGAVGWLLVRRRRRRGPTQTASGEPFEVREPSGDRVPALAGLSPLFDPFLPHLVRVARATKQPVAYAATGSGACSGWPLPDRAAAVGTIFAQDSDVCEALRLAIGQSEFFSELRHPALASVTQRGLSAPPEAYNVYETYELMTLTARPDDLGYDTEVISGMKEPHREQVVALLEAVYGVPCAAWLAASLHAGDVGWVAEEGGRVVGVAMATLVGDRARLHTLTVHPDHRNRGLGTALYRARLRALFDLGAAHVLTECATWNVAALELARAHGFQKAGVMYVESARSQRDPRKFVRR
ncbi:MAG: GNAT family N-acetyltransferase [Sandaracinaceae bacterium]|nr:GNAT family N-acetyltransferase [Sandaracinaceae bacterium]